MTSCGITRKKKTTRRARGTTHKYATTLHKYPSIRIKKLWRDTRYDMEHSKVDNPKGGFLDRIRYNKEIKAAYVNFARANHISMDRSNPSRYWLDEGHYIDVDVFDEESVKNAENMIYTFRRGQQIQEASPEMLAKRSAQKGGALQAFGRACAKTNPDALSRLWGGTPGRSGPAIDVPDHVWREVVSHYGGERNIPPDVWQKLVRKYKI